VEGRRHKVTTWKKLFRCSLGWNMPPGTKVLSDYRGKHIMHGKTVWGEKEINHHLMDSNFPAQTS